MKTRLTLLAALAVLAACGGEMDDFLDAGTEDAGQNFYALTGGTFALSNALASGTDQCGLLPAYQEAGKKIGLAMNGTSLTFNLANDSQAPANSLPTATLNGNDIDVQTEANYTAAFGDNCVVRIKRTVSGAVVADNTAALTLNFSVQTEAGSCGSATVFTEVPCAATYQFTATLAQ